jgi:hypothetical protein
MDSIWAPHLWGAFFMIYITLVLAFKSYINMKKTFILLTISILFLASCKDSNESNDFRNRYRWLTGKWEGSNGKVTMSETWQWKKSRFSGSGFEISGNDTLFSEELFIESFGSSDAYIAAMQSGIVTAFSSSQVDSVTWRFENQDHNFPSVIQYTLEGDTAMTVSLFARGETAFRGEHSYQLKRVK